MSWVKGYRLGNQLAGAVAHPGDSRYAKGVGCWFLIGIVFCTGSYLYRQFGCEAERPESLQINAPANHESRHGRHCGSANSRPADISAVAWGEYHCRTKSEAGGTWSRCLRHAEYSNVPGTGCPGDYGSAAEERCCPTR